MSRSRRLAARAIASTAATGRDLISTGVSGSGWTGACCTGSRAASAAGGVTTTAAAAGGGTATAPAVPRTGLSAGCGSAAAAGGAGGKLTVCGAASDAAGRWASTFSSAARTSVSTDFMSSGLLSAVLVPVVIGLISAALVPVVIGLRGGTVGVAFAVARAGWMGGGPASW